MKAINLAGYLEISGYRIERNDNHARRYSCRSWLSPIAYLHTVYHPASSETVTYVSKLLDLPIELRYLYQTMNGASLFGNVMHIYGCVEEGRQLDRSNPLSLPPFNILNMNRMFVPKEIARQFVCVGGYSYDRSLVCLARQSCAVTCFEGENFGKVRKSWQSMDEWLSDELPRLSLLFSDEGRLLVDEVYTLPDATLAH